MAQNQSNRKTAIQYCIMILSIIGLIVCIAVLFPQVRRMILDWGEQILHKESSTYQAWIRTLVSYAMGGICFILFFDYCTLTRSGRTLVHHVKQEMKDCLSEIDFRSLVKPLLLMFGIYLLGILAIIRANFLYMDDIGHAASGYREWHNWSRYVMLFLSYFVHPGTHVTDISPLPQLLAILILAMSSVLIIYVIGDKKITGVRLLASIPLGLSPYFLECLSYKFESPYMALSILASIIPFLFIERKKAFFFCSVLSLLIMCMTYQAASGIYLLIVVMLCFQDWNSKKKPNKEIFSFLCTSFFAFCLTMIMFKLFLVRAYTVDVSTTEMLSPTQLIPGACTNVKNYFLLINRDFGLIWKAAIVIIFLFFIIKSLSKSTQQKPVSFVVSLLVISIAFVLSYGAYSFLEKPLYFPRALFGFGVFLSILCIYISDYKKTAVVAVLALNWCFLVFAFSYGNALADQNRYTNFRISLLLHDLSTLYPNRNMEDMDFQLQNSIDYAPTIKNIAKHNPVIERLVPQIKEDDLFSYLYFLKYFNWGVLKLQDFSYGKDFVDFKTCDLPVVLDSYYHTIQSDGTHCLIILKH